MTAFCACVCVVWSQSVSFADKLKPFGRIWFGRPRQFGTDASSLSFSCSNIETKHSLPSLDGTDTKQRNTNPQRGPKAPFILFFFLVVESGLPCTRKCAQDWGDECKSSLFIRGGGATNESGMSSSNNTPRSSNITNCVIRCASNHRSFLHIHILYT